MQLPSYYSQYSQPLVCRQLHFHSQNFILMCGSMTPNLGSCTAISGSLGTIFNDTNLIIIHLTSSNKLQSLTEDFCRCAELLTSPIIACRGSKGGGVFYPVTELCGLTGEEHGDEMLAKSEETEIASSIRNAMSHLRAGSLPAALVRPIFAENDDDSDVQVPPPLLTHLCVFALSTKTLVLHRYHFLVLRIYSTVFFSRDS